MSEREEFLVWMTGWMMTPLTVVGGPAELGGLRVEVSGMCLDKQVQTPAGASAAYLLIK